VSAKNALVRIANENPKYRKQILAALEKEGLFQRGVSSFGGGARGSLIDKFHLKWRQVKVQHEKDLLDLKARHEKELKGLQESFREEEQKLKKEYFEEKEKSKEDFEDAFLSLMEKRTEDLEKLRERFRTDMQKVVTVIDQELEKGKVTPEEARMKKAKMAGEVTKKYDLEIQKFNLENKKKRLDLRDKYVGANPSFFGWYNQLVDESLFGIEWTIGELIKRGEGFLKGLLGRASLKLKGPPKVEALPV